MNTAITDDERQFLEACLKVYREDGGLSTPSENLITSLVLEYSVRSSLSPTAVARHTAEFAENLEIAIQHAQRIAGAYPDLFDRNLARQVA